MTSIIRRASAWLPVALSLLTLGIMLAYIAMHGPPAREVDEGAGAHLFQIWLVLEALMIAFFAIRWMPQSPKAALWILVVQFAAAVGACAPVFYYHL